MDAGLMAPANVLQGAVRLQGLAFGACMLVVAGVMAVS